MRGRTASFIGWLGTVLGATVAYPVPANLESLVTNSPFNGAAAPAGAAADAPLEFRGVFVDGGEYFFSLYDPASRSSMWVGLKEPGNPFTVQSYDSAKGIAAVEYKGRTLALNLKQSKVAALAPSAISVPVPAPAGGPPNATPAASTDDTNRLAAVAEEIRRRRALRAQQTTQAPAAKPATPPTRN